jgi:hypothetical protein
MVVQEAEDNLERAVQEHVARTDSFAHNARLRISMNSRARVSHLVLSVLSEPKLFVLAPVFIKFRLRLQLVTVSLIFFTEK